MSDDSRSSLIRAETRAALLEETRRFLYEPNAPGVPDISPTDLIIRLADALGDSEGEGKADTARLDWMERYQCAIDVFELETGGFEWCAEAASLDGGVEACAASLRSAIDAAQSLQSSSTSLERSGMDTTNG